MARGDGPGLSGARPRPPGAMCNRSASGRRRATESGRPRQAAIRSGGRTTSPTDPRTVGALGVAGGAASVWSADSAGPRCRRGSLFCVPIQGRRFLMLHRNIYPCSLAVRLNCRAQKFETASQPAPGRWGEDRGGGEQPSAPAGHTFRLATGRRRHFGQRRCQRRRRGVGS